MVFPPTWQQCTEEQKGTKPVRQELMFGKPAGENRYAVKPANQRIKGEKQNESAAWIIVIIPSVHN